MEFIKQYSGIASLVVLLIMGFVAVTHTATPTSTTTNGLAGSTNCGGITCLEGGLRLVSDAGGDFESDVAALFGSTVGITGSVSITGSTTIAATTTVKSLNMTGRPAFKSLNGAYCSEIFATSTATLGNITYAASTTAPTNGSGVIPLFAYGACN